MESLQTLRYVHAACVLPLHMLLCDTVIVSVQHVQRPGRRVAGCSLSRRVRPLLLGGFVSPRSGTDVSRLCVCL